MDPKYVCRDEVPADYLEHEKEILMAQAKEENPNKPENIIEKMITGRLNKEMKEICLLDQAYVQDSDMNVAKYVESVGKANGADLSIVKFVRFKTGEGLEKKQRHQCDVKKSPFVNLYIDGEMAGVGGVNSWSKEGQALPQYRVMHKGKKSFSFVIKPLNK